jgi:hypothetical protein
MTPLNQLNHLFIETVQGFADSLRHHMPFSIFRDFQVWALSPSNPYQKMWLQIIGIPQFAKLTETLLGQSVTPDRWAALVRCTTIMNAYLIYETVSDNLAFGLAVQRPDDPTYNLRREVLIAFNHAMIARLQGNKSEAEAIMTAVQPLAGQLSIFDHSLTSYDQRTVVQAFVDAHPDSGYTLADIEFGVWNALVANIESCAGVVEALGGFQLEPVLRTGLIRRYDAVNQLLYNTVTHRDALLQVSTDTILVVPVLTYYIAVLGEALKPNPQLGTVLHNGVLCQALEDAALMVRLLNDLGTNLVATEDFHCRLLDDLYAEITRDVSPPSTSFSAVLYTHSEHSQNAGFMTRIRKDLAYGEFNISLHNLMDAPSTPMSILTFGDNLLYFKHHYKVRQARLKQALDDIDRVLGEDTHCTLIRNFVDFHERIYQHQFDQQAGDYATRPDPVI